MAEEGRKAQGRGGVHVKRGAQMGGYVRWVEAQIVNAQNVHGGTRSAYVCFHDGRHVQGRIWVLGRWYIWLTFLI
jgi:hypothetical protein